MRTIGSVKRELVSKAREAALSAIRVFNDPQVLFKSETFIVLMNIAWTYLLHAYYRKEGIEYRYYRQCSKKRIFDRTKHGAYKYWELERCLNEDKCPLSKDTSNNLRFLIGLRHEIEHQMTRSLDCFLSGRYQACALNFNHYVKLLFGKGYALDTQLTYSIQFAELSEQQILGHKLKADVPQRLQAYITTFDSSLTHDEYNSSQYSYRMLFKRKLVNRPGQADRVVEFIDPNSELAKQIDKEYWVKKEVERPKYRALDVVKKIHEAGFKKFRICPEHTELWKSQDAKNISLGYGTNVQGTWYWYDTWVTKCLELCEKAGGKYK
jgi:hypothetical protein